MIKKADKPINNKKMINTGKTAIFLFVENLLCVNLTAGSRNNAVMRAVIKGTEIGKIKKDTNANIIILNIMNKTFLVKNLDN